MNLMNFFAVAGNAPAAASSSVTVNAPAAAGTAAEAAAGAASQTPASQPSMFTGMLPIIIVFAVMIFFMMRSQKKQQQKRQEMLDKIVKGSRVLLNSGMLGTVAEVREKTFVVEIADKVQVEVVKNGVADVVEEQAAAEKKA